MTLCQHHREVVARLAAMDHVGDEESTRAATALARQCPDCEEDQ